MGLIIFEALVLFKNFFIDKSQNKVLGNIFTVLLTLLLVFMVLESFFMFFPRSHGVGDTLGAKLWDAKYWYPKNFNSFGYRDIEPTNSQPAVFFVGDSFTAGHGLENPDDRFSNIVRRELRKKDPRSSIVNIARNGFDTSSEYEAMSDFIQTTNIKPQTIILQYYGNDIEKVAWLNGIVFKGFASYTDIPGFLVPVVKGSYLGNYLYWMLPKPYDVPYADYLEGAYKNTTVLSKHKNDLNRFIEYARANSAQLIVVLFPFIEDLAWSSAAYVDEIADFFSKKGVPVIDVSRLVQDMPVKDRLVNANDSHASKKVNMLVAQEILRKLNN